MKVNIVMSTYNGEKYLAEQIESIQNQTFSDWTLLIRDDGSTDSTVETIKKYVSEDSRIKFINEEEPKNLGVIKSFYSLIKYNKADYYFFSDQDDYWLPEKLEIALTEAKKHDNSKPMMYYTDLKVVDRDLKVLNESMIKSQSGHANTKLIQELTENSVTGGVSMINNALADKWTVTDNIIMHDWYLALLASALGELVYIDKPTELYRQHDNNVLGARTLDKKFKILREGPKKIFTRYWTLIHQSQDQAEIIVKLFSDQIGDRDKELIENFVDIDKKSFIERFKRLIKYKYTKNQKKHIIVFRALILFNLYNKE
ncbi:alpha-L-Rha alpha-1,3-L-rhamnosyltransferase [Floricoccus tropicus]|uniref:Alpha-L-Rha alpha-1,3-L-rhamnosyltransferase n=1 Tax=Floricoccus tropicus TaxID=1859473 RepID=A0A1E8GKF5_9LACT|nr:glycosyltransferase family 2 protein [Floricoccus tropicus]OFI48724.1 alpha-L-Rha alpha-1,3-L-rhamnosyltransferase [Floricoccus tropicus]